MGRAKNLCFNTILVLASLLLAFGVLELGIRVWYGNNLVFIYPQAEFMQVDYGYKFKPNQHEVHTLDKNVDINSFGFRDSEWEVPKKKGKIRVLCVGDSLTFGNAAPQQDVYPKAMEQMLQSVDPNFEVFNAGVSGWATYNETDFVIREGLQLEPDFVILGFYPNDYSTRPEDPRPLLSDDGRYDGRPSWLRWLPYRTIFLLKRSALVTYLRDRLANITAGEEDGVTLLLKNKIDLDQLQWVRDTYSYIREMKVACDRKGVKTIVASIPPLNMFWFPKGPLKYNEHLRSFCESNGITFIDLSTEFWKVKDTNSLYYFPWDGHLRPTGHKLVANQLSGLILNILKK